MVKRKTIKAKILLYIKIIIRLFEEDIQFDRSKSLPLILHGSFLQCKKFIEFCQTLLKCFDITNSIKWDQSASKTAITVKTDGKSRTKYLQNSGRSKQLFQDYLKCIQALQFQLSQSCDETFIQNGANKLTQWINNAGMFQTVYLCTNLKCFFLWCFVMQWCSYPGLSYIS